MGSFLINKSVKERHCSDTMSVKQDDNSELVSCLKKTAKV